MNLSLLWNLHLYILLSSKWNWIYCIWGSDNSDYEEESLLDCNDLYFGEIQFFEVTYHFRNTVLSVNCMMLHPRGPYSSKNWIFSHRFICESCLFTVGPGMQSYSSQIHSTDDCGTWEISWSLDLWFCGWQVWYQNHWNILCYSDQFTLLLLLQIIY